jgi:hypothetical protein
MRPMLMTLVAVFTLVGLTLGVTTYLDQASRRDATRGLAAPLGSLRVRVRATT